MKLLFGVWGLTSGGAERVLSVLCSKLAGKGHEVHLYIRFQEEDEYALDSRVIVHRFYDKSIAQLAEEAEKTEEAEEAEEKEVEQRKTEINQEKTREIPVPSWKIRYYRGLKRRVRKWLSWIIHKIPFLYGVFWIYREKKTAIDSREMLTNLIRQVKPDIIIPFLAGAESELYFANKEKVPFIHCVRVYQTLHQDEIRVFHDYMAIKATAIFTQTLAQKQYYCLPWLRKKCFVIGNPVNSQFLDCPVVPAVKRIRKLIAVGRLTGQKNYGMMLQAIKIASAQYSDIQLSVYGNGEDKERIQAQIVELGLQEMVSVFPRNPNILGKLQKAHLFLMTSDWEGMPNALMEAMAIGIPCIATDCLSGPKDLIGENERGLLVPCGDALKLAEALLYDLEHPEEAFEKAVEGSRFIRKHYNPDVIAEEFERQCSRLLL